MVSGYNSINIGMENCKIADRPLLASRIDTTVFSITKAL
ncbi:Uncharacterised protein [Mycobacteroides abscessus subsp. massiliense]|nr:Uncharacterised protein [Mycobacteroides abscessus subsp. massiliense]